MTTRLALLWLLVAAVGCGDITPTNPYDPSTPSSQQETSTISGALQLFDENHPDEPFGPELFMTGVVRLLRVGDEAGEVADTTVDGEGRFLFEEVPPGDYLVRAHVDGFSDAERAFSLAIGVDYQLGEIRLPAVSAPDSVANLVGVAHRADAPPDSHGGIRVQVLGTPWQADTEDSGAYRLAVGPGLYDLHFSADGYGAETLSGVRALAGQETALPEVVLTSRPGTVVGQVVLTSPDGQHMFTESDVLGVALTLVDLDRAAEPRVGNPTADGRFQFTDVPAGHYALSADATGFLGAQATADVVAGEVRNLGALHLEARIDARLLGVARRECAVRDCDHSGIVVHAVDSPFVTVTAPDGSYLLSLSAGPYTLEFALEGHEQPTPPISGVAEPGTQSVEPVTLRPKPAAVLAVLHVDGVGLEGGHVSVLAVDAATGAERLMAEGNSGPDGLVALEFRAPAGPYFAHVTAPRREAARLPVVLGPGVVADLGVVDLPVEPGRVTGLVARSDGPTRGAGVTLLFEGNAADPLTAGRAVRAVTTPPDDAFDVALPAGAWWVTPLADDYITPPATELIVPVGDRAELALALQRRTHLVALPPILSRRAEAVFTRDDDLRFGRVWWDADEPPPDLPLLPLEGPDADRLTFDVGEENRLYVLHFQLANQRFLDAPADAYAALTPVLTASAVLDTEPPEVERVEVAGGASEVHTLVVPVTVAATGATWLGVWNAEGPECAGAPVCGQDALEPFTGGTVHTLDAQRPDADQFVCALVCDALCNCATPASAVVHLGTFRDRPTPVLDALDPATLEVHTRTSAWPDDRALPQPDETHIKLTGSGIADDTVAVVGAIELPCEPPPGAPDGHGCRADVPGTCLDTCIVDLARPEAAGLRDNAGTYAVWLRTPDPVVGGEGVSATRFLTVYTELPVIETLAPRGITVADLSDPNLRGLLEQAEFGGIDFSAVFPTEVVVTLRVCRDADNAQFRLGSNVGTFVRPPGSRVFIPRDAPSVCAGRFARDVTVRFATERLTSLAAEDQVIGVLNPSPGGGLGTEPFGITNVVENCMLRDTCIVGLTSRRPLDGAGTSTYFGSLTDFSDQFSGLAWHGGDAGVLHWRYKTEDVQGVLDNTHPMGQVAARVTPETAGGLLPAMLGQPYSLSIYDSLGRQPQVSLHAVRLRNDGRFAASAVAVRDGLDRDPQDIVVEDFDADGQMDAVVSSCLTSQLLYQPGPLLNVNRPVQALGALVCPRALDTADFDSDGRPDLVHLLDNPSGISVRLNAGGGRFTLPVNYPMQRNARAMAVADFDRDGHVDVLTGSPDEDCELTSDGVRPELPCAQTRAGRLFIRWGRGVRGVLPAQAVVPPAPPGGGDGGDVLASRLAVGDLDQDGLPDLVVAHAASFWVLRGTGDRARPFGWFPGGGVGAARDGHWVTGIALGDLDADGRADLVMTTQDADPARAVPAGEAGPQAGGLLTWLGAGPGNFTKVPTVELGPVSSPRVGDLNGDARPDVAVMDGAGRVQWLARRPDAGYEPPRVLALSDARTPYRIADVDRDGAQDLVGFTTGRGVEAIQVRRGLGRRAFGASPPALPAGAGAIDTVPLDYNRDGHVDLAVLGEQARRVDLYQGDGEGGFTPGPGPFELDLPPGDALAEDIDDDGNVDLVITTANGQARQVLRGDRGTFVVDDAVATPGETFGFFDPTTNCYGPVFPRERLLGADLDGDGRREILHATGGVIERMRRYDYASGFYESARLPFFNDCGAGFTVWDNDGHWRTVAYSAGTAAVDVDLPEGLTTLYGVRARQAEAELGTPAWRRIVATGDYEGFSTYQMYGSGLETGDFDGDGRDELILFGQLGDHRYSNIFRPPGHRVLSQRDMQASAIDGWLDVLEGVGVTRLSPTVDDFNGDGLPDAVGAFPERAVANIRLRRDAETGYSDLDEFFPLAGGAPARTSSIDVNHDGVPDLFVANALGDSVSYHILPSPETWTLALLDPQMPRTALSEGVRVPLGRVRQAFQDVSQIAVNVHLEGEGLNDVTLSLQSPAGQIVPLGRGPARGDWRATFKAPQTDFSRLFGAQPTDDWTLLADVGPAAHGRLLAFQVVTRGAFVQAKPGFSAARPRPLRFPVGATGRALRDSTLGANDTVDLSCAQTGSGQPERWIEGELALPTDVEFQLAAAFDAALEIREGPCASPGAVRACAVGRGAHVAPVTLDAGRFCAIVAGVSGRGIQSGAFDLFAFTADPAPDPCAQGGCLPEPDAGFVLDAAPSADDAAVPTDDAAVEPPVDAAAPQDAGVPGEVMCGAAPCQETCCVGFAGPHCAGACGPGEREARCDGPEDCAPGEQCCADLFTGARCGQCGAGQSELCHLDAECSAGQCIGCLFPGFGHANLCSVGGCP